MSTPTTPRKVVQDERLTSNADAVPGEGTVVTGDEIRAARDGVFEYDEATRTCVVRAPRRPVAGTRRKRGERAPTDADLRDTAARPTRSTTRDTAKLKKKKGRGDQGTWM